MEGVQELPQSLGLAGKIRERLWRVIEKDTLSQKVQKQWADVSRAAAEKMDARSLARFKMTLSDQADSVGKVAAISGNAMNIILGAVIGAVGIKNIWSARGSSWVNRQQAKTQMGWGIIEAGVSPVVFGMRPVERAELLLGRAAISLKKESKQLSKQVFVGTGKA